MSKSISNADLWSAPVTALRGVGPERAAQLARLGISITGELLLHRPRRYEDRREVFSIGELTLEKPATARGKIVALGLKRFRKGFRSLFEIILDDGRARLHCRWWNAPYMQNFFKQGDEVMVYGSLNSLKPRTMDHPETEVIEGGEESSIHLNRIVPIYPLTEGMPQRWLRSLLWRTVEEHGKNIPDLWPAANATDIPSRPEAIRMLHFPVEIAEATQARRRLALDEFIGLQLHMQERRRRLLAKAEGRPCPGDNRLIRPFLHALGFAMTGAQTRVLRELREDMSLGKPMRRLLQGDVGSGKTVVAACCALMALESGYNVALMAPTEILAEQHYRNFSRWLEPLSVAVHLHTGSQKTMGDQQQSILPLNAFPENHPQAAVPAENAGTVVIGTHALIESSFALENLGLVIIDEQHKFGVAQREKLVRKGRFPHLLVMTATPIPRTLGLTLYGDLDISVIDEMPAGRTPVKTYLRTADKLPKIWSFIRSKLEEGRQAFIVYPRVEDSGTSGVKAVTKELETVKKELQPFQVGLLHGRLKPDDKESVMTLFRENRLQVLLATSLIEVGIDVPNATIMLIENADQFGLAQLHQLRGRIGRGGHESYCILVAAAKNEEAQERLRILEQTNDGFQIAEADLKIRGPGDLIGSQQSGLPPLQFGNLAEDLDLIERARGIATTMVREKAA